MTDFRTFPVRACGGGTSRRLPKDWDGDFSKFLPAPPRGMEGVAVAADTTYRWGHEEECFTIEWSDGTVSGGLLYDYDFSPANRGW